MHLGNVSFCTHGLLTDETEGEAIQQTAVAVLRNKSGREEP